MSKYLKDFLENSEKLVDVFSEIFEDFFIVITWEISGKIWEEFLRKSLNQFMKDFLMQSM